MAVDLGEAKAPTKGLSAPVLVLNKNFQPVRLTNAKQGFLLLYLGRARALDSAFEPHDFQHWSARTLSDADETIGTPRGPIAVPRLLQLNGFSRMPQSPLRLSRKNIFLRDKYTCQYCGVRPTVKELNLDHVQPRSRGGRSTWENLVTSCRRCNMNKANQTPDEAGLTLRTRPHRPGWSVALMMATPHHRYAEWAPFLGDV